MRQGRDRLSTFMPQRFDIYASELGPTFLLMTGLLSLVGFRRKPTVVLVGLLSLTALDLLSLKSLRAVEDGPVRPLVDQSPVLKYLEQNHRETGARSVDPFGNLAMVGGGSPIVAYRTLDLPGRPGLEQDLRHRYFSFKGGPLGITRSRLSNECDIGVWIDPKDDSFERNSKDINPDQYLILEDPALTGWLYGRKVVEGASSTNTEYIAFLTGEGRGRAHKAQLDNNGSLVLEDPRIPYLSRVPEHAEVELTAEKNQRVVISNLWDPEWAATFESSDGKLISVPVESQFDPTKRGGWQSIVVPGSGHWKLHLSYQGKSARTGQWISIASWLGWLCLWFYSQKTKQPTLATLTSSECEGAK